MWGLILKLHCTLRIKVRNSRSTQSRTSAGVFLIYSGLPWLAKIAGKNPQYQSGRLQHPIYQTQLALHFMGKFIVVGDDNETGV